MMHHKARMMIMMHPHAFNPHLMVPPSFATVKPDEGPELFGPPPTEMFGHDDDDQNEVEPPPMSLGHMAPPPGTSLPPIHFRMMVHGMPHGAINGPDAALPEGLSEIVNEMMPKILPQMVDFNAGSTQDKVSSRAASASDVRQYAAFDRRSPRFFSPFVCSLLPPNRSRSSKCTPPSRPWPRRPLPRRLSLLSACGTPRRLTVACASPQPSLLSPLTQ